MVTTRSSKRQTPPLPLSPERPAKTAKIPEKPKPTATTTTSSSSSSTSTLNPKQSLSNITTLLLDIEGTICPITFVKDVLFPHFLTALPSHLASHWSSPALGPYLAAFPPEHASDADTLLAHATDLVTRDVKAPYLKALQGHIWEDGYRSGAYAAPVYPDVLDLLDRWPSATAAATDGGPSTNGSTREATALNGSNDATSEKKPSRVRQVAIYSSGSVPAQKLFVEHVRDPSPPTATSSDSDSALTKAPVLDKRLLISDWFDTVNAGPKQEPGSYTTIAKKLDREPEEILFLSDNVTEVKAALEAGIRSIIVEREGNAPLSDQDKKDFEVITTFDHLDLL